MPTKRAHRRDEGGTTCSVWLRRAKTVERREITPEAEALWREVEEAIDSEGLETRTVPLLVRLARVAPPGSEAWLFAHRQLAMRAVAEDPWRASLLARRVLRRQGDDEEAWGIIGLAQSLLGNHDYAVHAYSRALLLSPNNPWYAHNLGHLYDVALDQPHRAVPLLRRALEQLDCCPGATACARLEVAASYAHALMRVGEHRAAREIMIEVVRGGRPRPEHHALYGLILRHENHELATRVAQAPPPRKMGRRRLKRRRTAVSSRS